MVIRVGINKIQRRNAVLISKIPGQLAYFLE